jgi:nucleoside-diphosphate-sugar epimerase
VEDARPGSETAAARRVLVAGCGYVGRALAEALAAQGHEVFALRRSDGPWPAGARGVRADLADPASLAALPPGLDAVVYAAAADGFDDAAYRAAYVDGPRNLVDALRRAGQPLGRFLFTSSTAVYAQQGGEWVDESSPTEPEGFSGRRLRQGEAVVHGAPWPGVVLRLGGIYGPGRTRLVESVRSGRARLRPGPPLYTNRIHRDDCAGALAHLLALPRPDPVYVGVDREPADEADVLRWMASRLGVPAPAVSEDHAEIAAGGAPRRVRGSKRCSSARLAASGYALRFPTYREGYAALIEAGGAATAGEADRH